MIPFNEFTTGDFHRFKIEMQMKEKTPRYVMKEGKKRQFEVKRMKCIKKEMEQRNFVLRCNKGMRCKEFG